MRVVEQTERFRQNNQYNSR